MARVRAVVVCAEVRTAAASSYQLTQLRYFRFSLASAWQHFGGENRLLLMQVFQSREESYDRASLCASTRISLV